MTGMMGVMGMTISSELAIIEDVESSFLCELVDRLTATRSERAVRTTIATWKDRVQAAGLDPEGMLAAFSEAPCVVHPCGEVPRWADASKREFVLVCIAVYARRRDS